MSGEVEKCPILHVRPKFDVFTLIYSDQMRSPGDVLIGYQHSDPNFGMKLAFYTRINTYLDISSYAST